MTLSRMTLSLLTLSITGFFATLINNDAQNNHSQFDLMLSLGFFYIEMLIVIRLNVVIVYVVAPFCVKVEHGCSKSK
jgi:hypothetical protein